MMPKKPTPTTLSLIHLRLAVIALQIACIAILLYCLATMGRAPL